MFCKNPYLSVYVYKLFRAYLCHSKIIKIWPTGEDESEVIAL